MRQDQAERLETVGRTARKATAAEELPTHRREFHTAFAETLEAVDLPHNRIAAKAGLPASSISCYNTGRRVPEQAQLEKLYKTLEAEARRGGVVLPHSLPHLLNLREAARIEKIAPVAADATARASGAEPAADTGVTHAAAKRGGTLGGLRQRRLMRKARLAHRKFTAPSAPATAPVPPQEGDRRIRCDGHIAEISDYRRHLTEGRFRDAHFIAWSMGSLLPSAEFPHAVESYRRADAAEGAEVMLGAAAAREFQASVNIIAALLDEGQLNDVRALLSILRTDN
ncbi:hypothetical protein [Streptomyces spectabilis]|uniref:Uncharacterized protein n=1 Tax=Streptomyces spectabilis TaxID=68270 RepID=A0A516R7Z7_STRST|nr:hypothetical protein [Streptomyces spectabilis]QDQ11764.1 hypothetical protein FH965_15280 [Streptomyces spectabilis]